MRSVYRRIERLEKSRGVNTREFFSVRIVILPEQARVGDPKAKGEMWGLGKNTWHVYKAPNQTIEDALLAVGIDPDLNTVVVWPH